MKRKVFHISPGFYLLIAASLLWIPIRWMIAWLIAAVFHELCHLLALKFCCCRIYSIKLGFDGAKIDAQLPLGIKTAVCALAGPLGGLMLLPIYRVAPRTALCALIQSLFNLLPFYPMDGGRVLFGLVCAIAGEERAARIMSAVEKITCILMLVLSVYISIVWHLGLLPVFICIFLSVRNKNIPCKRSPYRVQYL